MRERLVAAAAGLIASDGTPAATSRAITERAGENLAAITYYFGSKDALVAEALTHHARAVIQPVLAELTGERPPAERLLAAVHMLTTILDEHRDQLPAYVECLAQTSRNVAIAHEVRQLWRGLQQQLAEEIARQQAQGPIPTWVVPGAMAALIVALANGVVASAVVDPDRTDPAAIGLQFASLLLAVRNHDART